MVGREGFEPSTNWLKANCSTNWANGRYKIYILGLLALLSFIIKSLSSNQSTTSISYKLSLKVVGREGFEPSTNWLKANCSTNWANGRRYNESLPQCGAYNTHNLFKCNNKLRFYWYYLLFEQIAINTLVLSARKSNYLRLLTNNLT